MKTRLITNVDKFQLGYLKAKQEEIEWLESLNSNDIRDLTKDVRIAKLKGVKK